MIYKFRLGNEELEFDSSNPLNPTRSEVLQFLSNYFNKSLLELENLTKNKMILFKSIRPILANSAGNTNDYYNIYYFSASPIVASFYQWDNPKFVVGLIDLIKGKSIHKFRFASDANELAKNIKEGDYELITCIDKIGYIKPNIDLFTPQLQILVDENTIFHDLIKKKYYKLKYMHNEY